MQKPLKHMSYLGKFSTNPLMAFIYALISKWYIIIMVPAVITVFWVFKGLESTGLLQKAEEVILKATNDAKAVAKFCVPKITNMQDFFYCLQNTPQYNSDPDDKDLQKLMQEELER